MRVMALPKYDVTMLHDVTEPKLTKEMIDEMRAEMETVIRQQAVTISQLEEELRIIEMSRSNVPPYLLASQQTKEHPDIITRITMRRQPRMALGIRILQTPQRPKFPKRISGSREMFPAETRGPTVSQLAVGGVAETAGMCVGDLMLTVNGKDLSNATHQQTVEALNQAQEPIIVEVLRRPSNTATNQSSQQSTMNTVSTQTEAADAVSTEECSNSRLFVMPSPPPLNSSVEEVRSLAMSCSDLEQTYDVEYDEVILKRTSASDRIGLTLCYGETDEDGFTDIFIGEVEDNSIAGKDGNIQEGDQIIKINNQEVRNREEAIRLFSETRSEIVLLICRPASLNQMDDGFLEECGSNFDAESLDSFSYQHDYQVMPLIEERSEFEDDSTLTDTATLPSQKEKEAKDSGVGQDSAASSEQECEFSHNDSLFDDHELTAEVEGDNCGKFRQILESRCMNLPDNTIDQLCNKLVKIQHDNNNRVVPKMGVKIMHHNDSSLPRSMTESVDTAYNTDSCKSCPTTLELTKGLSGSSLSISSKPSRRSHDKKRSRRSTASPSKSSNHSDTVYTTEDKLAETMATQQRVLLQQSRSSTLTRDTVNNQTDNVNSDGSNMEWVVKRRSDGSRYVTRRPIRSKIMSERKKKLEKERCGMTTDDDAMSELKTGRHWSRDDRRRHVQKSREHQQRKAMMEHQIKMSKQIAREGQSNILELSHKKLHRHAMKDIDFTTVQELLAHGGKIPLPSCGLVSVTTV